MKKKLILITLLFTLFIGNNVIAQQSDSVGRKSYTDETGRLFWNKKLPLYLRVASTPDGAGQLLNSESMPEYTNPVYLDTEGKNLIRTRYAVDQKTGKTILPKREVLWEIYADGIAPKTSAKFYNAPAFQSKEHLFYGKGLEVELKAIDGMSGVENIFCSVTNSDFVTYNKTLIFGAEGNQNLKIYSADKVGNKENVRNFDFIVDLTPPVTKHNVTGIVLKNIISTATKIYLEASDNLSGVSTTYYQIDDYSLIKYNGLNIPINYLSDGTHKLKYYSIDKVSNQETTIEYEFYLDKTAPILASDILGDRFIVNDQIYFSGRTKLKLTAVDNKAGVKDILFSIDGNEFSSYDAPFYLPSKPGMHIVRYFALDKLENETEGSNNTKTRYEEFKHSVSKIYVDLTGPSLSHAFIGQKFKTRDTLFISPNTKIKLSGQDAESGMQYISYSVDGQQEEIKYSEPFSIEKHGAHSIEIFGYDNVNNRNINKINIVVDSEAPEIGYTFSIRALGKKEGVDKYPQYVKIYLSAQDAMIGTKDIYYSINDGEIIKYHGNITGFIPDKINKILIKAIDELTNESKTELKFYIEK